MSDIEQTGKNEKHKTETDQRLEKLNSIKAEGGVVFAGRYETTNILSDIPTLEDGTSGIKIAGRVVSMRTFGKLIFAHIFSAEGTSQVALQKNEIPESFDLFRAQIDVGDYIGVCGSVFTTKGGEKSVNVSEWTLLSKALRPLPDKFHGLADTEQRLRKRYLDLISSPEVMDRFKKRTLIIRTIRNFLDANRFMEIDTPILTNKASGAMATPFATHHNALDLDIFLRIAPETYLKRAVAGGFERVYEIARCFRNEGMDPSHLPDFTMLEFYASYWDYQDNMNFTEKFIKHILTEVFGSLEVTYAETKINFDGNWPRVSFRDLLLKDCGIDIDVDNTAEALLARIKEKNISLDAKVNISKLGFGNIIDLLYKKVSRPGIVAPLFVTGHPVDLSPLARRNEANPSRVDRFQLVVNGWEIVNAYSELVDPIDQAGRFDEQMKARAGGDAEAMETDSDFVVCMEHGMPPMSGFGMGIDRLTALLTDAASLREVVLFPLMRPE